MFNSAFMRKTTTIIIISMTLVLVLFAANLPKHADAAIPYKNCEGCHVLYKGMMDKVDKKDKKNVQDVICANCHTSTTGDPIKMMGGVRVPIVYNTKEPFSSLAGGNFYYVATFGERKGHNVAGINNSDAKFGSMPPGYDKAHDQSSIGYKTGKPLTCAGSNGCHGDRNIENPFEAIMGAHHADDNFIDGTTTAKSYRYLKITGASKGVLGLEDEDWGQDSSSRKHNEYSLSINELCIGCHDGFHGKDKAGGEELWFRHPVGIELPSKGEYKDYLTYNPEAPLARAVIPGKASRDIKPGSDIVVCLSCHMAHGSPYDSSLRWDFKAMYSGKKSKGGGCLICHTKKR